MELEIKILEATDLKAFIQLLDIFDIAFEHEVSPGPDGGYLEGL